MINLPAFLSQVTFPKITLTNLSHKLYILKYCRKLSNVPLQATIFTQLVQYTFNPYVTLIFPCNQTLINSKNFDIPSQSPILTHSDFSIMKHLKIKMTWILCSSCTGITYKNPCHIYFISYNNILSPDFFFSSSFFFHLHKVDLLISK